MDSNSSMLAKKSMESVLIMGIAMAISTVVSALGRFYLATELGAQIFGDFTLTLALVGFVTLFSNTLGDRFIVATNSDQRVALNTVFSTELLLWLTIVAVWFIFSPHWWPQISKGANWGLASLLLLKGLAFPLSRPRALLERNLNFKTVAFVNVSTHILTMALAIFLAQNIKNSTPLVILALVGVLQSVVFFIIGRNDLSFGITKSIFRSYVRLCLPLMVVGFVVFFYWNFDRVLLDRYVDRVHLGYYGWSFSLGAFILTLKDVVSRVLFPVFAKLMREGNLKQFQKGLTALYKTLGLLYGLIVPALVISAPKLVLLAGQEWAPAATCVQISILIFTLRAFNSFLEPVFVIFGKSNPLMYLSFLNGILIVVGGWAALEFQPQIESMALVILLSSVLTFGICSVIINNLCGVNLFKVVAPSFALAALSTLIMSVMVFWLGQSLSALVVSVLTGLGIYLTGSKNEIWKIGGLIKHQWPGRT